FYFDNGGTSLWKTDGNTASLVKSFNGPPPVTYPQPVVIGNSLYFAQAHNGSGLELYVSDGTTAGNTLVYDINPSGDSSPSDLVNVGGTLYFSAIDGTHGRELWQTDGTMANTSLVDDLVDLSGSSIPIPFAGANGILYVSAKGNDVGREA